MGKPRDIIGKKFGMLTIDSINRSEPRKDRPKESIWIWNCSCACGNKTEADGGKLRGVEPSCGCLTFKKKSAAKTKHGHTKNRKPSSEYVSYHSMISRCYNPNIKEHKYYNHIKVCDRWLGEKGFEHFLEDMGLKPTLKHTIEKIDNNKDYGPENCKWITKSEQPFNRRTTIKIIFRGELGSARSWSLRLGFNQHYISKNLRKGWSLEKIFNSTEVQFA